MKKNVWVPVLSALLIVGVLIGAIVWIGKGTSGGGGGGTTAGTTAKPEDTTTAKPAETTAEVKRKTVVNNASAKYFSTKIDGLAAFGFYSDSLKPNTRYSVAFSFAQDDVYDYISPDGGSFQYVYLLHTPADGEKWNAIATDSGVSPGKFYDFTTDANGVLYVTVFRGPLVMLDNAEGYQNVIRDQMPFLISEIVG